MINPAIENDLKNMSLNDVNYADYIKENYIQIPDNATNGDVIKAVFPDVSVYEHNGGATYSVNNEYNFNATWWNSPYKADKESEENRMKLIINIPQTAYDAIQAFKDVENTNEGTLENVLIKAVEEGIPLDKIRAEILQMPTISLNANDIYKADVLAIMDKYKAESEEE